jgi:two-component system phosphate regulon sensor histidine kinase PhoR
MGSVLRQGLLAPAGIAAATLLAWLAGGTGWALVALGLGAAIVVGMHLYRLQRLADWAGSALDTPVPEGRGVWEPVYAALYRRTRLREAYQRDLQHIIDRFQLAAEAIPDGIVILDQHNRIEWANPHAVGQLGLDVFQDVGQPIVNIVRQPEFLRYLSTGDFGESTVVPSSRDAGRSLALQLVPFAIDKKLLMSRDVTEMESVARIRRDFIANVSHELKTPLTVISGFVETLQDLDVDSRQRTRFLQLMQEQARNMQRLVADLLTLSALETDQGTTDDERFAVAPLLLALASDARALSKGQHAIELDLGIGASVLGSRDELASAFGNLVSNAIRYTPEGGRIALAWLVEPGGSATFSVTDSGIGIAAEHVPRLTERFYRVDRSRSRATGGTGLGLAIVKHVLLRHQAQLEITSEPGRGSRFAVRLPARRITVAPAPPVEPAGAGADRSEAQRPFESG